MVVMPVKDAKTIITSLLSTLDKELEGEKEKHGFMPLGTSDDPWNKALNLAQERIKKLIK